MHAAEVGLSANLRQGLVRGEFLEPVGHDAKAEPPDDVSGCGTGAVDAGTSPFSRI